MIRVLVVDDHEAVRAGLRTVLDAEPDLVCAGAASNERELWPLMHRTRPDVVITDYDMSGTDGLTLCHRIKTTVPAPGVLVYSAWADAALTIPAHVAGADAIVHKAAPARSLLDALRAVAAGDAAMPAVSPDAFARATLVVDARDLPIFDMLVDRRPLPEIAAFAQISVSELAERIDGILDALRVTVATPG